jgi:hypothetical protein
MFPRVGSQILIEPGSPEDFHVMEVKNVPSDRRNVTGFRAKARLESRLDSLGSAASTSVAGKRGGAASIFGLRMTS